MFVLLSYTQKQQQIFVFNSLEMFYFYLKKPVVIKTILHSTN